MAPDSSPAIILDALRAWVQTVCPDCFDDVYPYLGWMMAIPLGDEVEAMLRGLGPEGLKAGTFRAVETVLQGMARRRPQVIVCEDLHWADPTSMELLERLLPLTDRAPLLFIFVFRPETDRPCWRVKERASRLYSHRHSDLWLKPLPPN